MKILRITTIRAKWGVAQKGGTQTPRVGFPTDCLNVDDLESLMVHDLVLGQDLRSKEPNFIYPTRGSYLGSMGQMAHRIG